MARPDFTTSLKQVLVDLENERDRIERASAALRATLAQLGGVSVRSRPGPTPGRRKPHWSPAMKAAARARMQRYWAARKKPKAKASAPRKPARAAAKARKAPAAAATSAS